MDLVFHANTFPQPGETVSGLSFETFPGGKGANQAVAIGKLAGHCLFVGKVGSDGFGDELSQSLSLAGVEVSGLRRSSELRTGVASINVDSSGQNQIIVVPGANADLAASEAITSAGGFQDAAIALFQHETPRATVDACIIEAAKKHCRVILNPAPARSISDDVLASLEFITPNETEAKILTGIDVADHDSCALAAKWFHDRGVKGVVITLGSRGCFYSFAGVQRIVPAPSVQPVDTTAAGDAFNGAFSMFLSQGRSVENALSLANCVGALSTTRHGAQASIPTLSELKTFAGSLY
jgi:ribokinase